MSRLTWDQLGERFYQTGIDQGVLYLHDGTVAIWNGIISVEEDGVTELKSFHLDGVKYLETLIPGDFSAKLTAFTYPEEFDRVSGIVDVGEGTSPTSNPIPGLYYHDQPSESFNLSYRTKVGNDLEGENYGYKIHLLYNVIAEPDGHSFESIGDAIEPIEFSWTLTGTPEKAPRLRPTCHVSVDSRNSPPEVLQLLEAVLYGTETTNPTFPSITEIGEYFGYLGALIIIDHGDGTWSAVDESDTYITMTDTTVFEIDGADATYLDPVTYEVQSTNVGQPG